MDIDVLIETYRVCKEYIPQKDRQAAADHVINSISEFDVSESDLQTFAGVDAYIKRAVEEYLGEELDVAHDEESGDDFNSW